MKRLWTRRKQAAGSTRHSSPTDDRDGSPPHPSPRPHRTVVRRPKPQPLQTLQPKLLQQQSLQQLQQQQLLLQQQKYKKLSNKDGQRETLAPPPTEPGTPGRRQQLPVVPEEEEGETTILGGYEQLASIIRNRGYHVREHVPRKVLETQIMDNIRRREKIAMLLRMQEVPGNPPPLTVPLPKKPQPPPPPDAMRTAHTLALITKVWSRNRARKLALGSGFIEWSRNLFVQDCLKEHNRVRALHNSPPLLLSQYLCEEAQQWANRLAQKKILEYSNKYGRGESILTSCTTEGITGAGAVRSWYETGRTYNYRCPSNGDLAHAGEFAQLLWSSTKELGIGVSRGEGSRVVVVARYSPPGNLPGQFLSNVKPPVRGLPSSAQLSRTREEAHMSVQTALLPPSPKNSIGMGAKKKSPNTKVNQNGLQRLLVGSKSESETAETSVDDEPVCKGRTVLPVCCGMTVGRRRTTAPGTPRPARHLSGHDSHGVIRTTGPSQRMTVSCIETSNSHLTGDSNSCNTSMINAVPLCSQPLPSMSQVRPPPDSGPARVHQPSRSGYKYSAPSNVIDSPSSSRSTGAQHPRSARVYHFDNRGIQRPGLAGSYLADPVT